MKLFLLRPVKDWTPWYDTAMGFIVSAASEDDARTFATGECGDEGDLVWLNSGQTTCVEIAKRTSHKAGVVLRDFAAG